MDGIVLFPIVLPILAGVALVIMSFREHLAEAGNVESGKCEGKAGIAPGNHLENGDGNRLFLYVGIAMAAAVVLALALSWTGERTVTLFELVDGLPVVFRADALGRLFVTVTSIVWLAATVYAFGYMKKEGNKKRYFGFWLLLYGVLVAIDFSGNLITLYLFYELMTLVSMPLVLHNGTKEAAMAALKYLFYSLCGAYGGLCGIFFLNRYCDSLVFTPGGTLDPTAVQGHEGILLVAMFAMLAGFGAKAGMFPLHAWLPAAHPVAPSPASAVLSAVIVKSGVLAVIRGVFYVAGADFLRGTWVQYAWMSLSLLTVFMGSMLAFREQGFKKRLAYSTVSQVSYILFGLSLLTPGAMTGSLLHIAVHAFVKCGLFLAAGIFLQCFGYTKVGQLSGIGKKMPGLMWCYTILSLALTGIPPTGGFISKWYLAEGALQSHTGIFTWLGPAVLLVSALLTAGYLLPAALRGFFPGTQGEGSGQGAFGAGQREAIPLRGNLPGEQEAALLHGSLPGEQEAALRQEGLPGEREAALRQEGMAGETCPARMVIPVALLAVLALLLGVFPNALIAYVEKIVFSVYS